MTHHFRLFMVVGCVLLAACNAPATTPPTPSSVAVASPHTVPSSSVTAAVSPSVPTATTPTSVHVTAAPTNAPTAQPDSGATAAPVATPPPLERTLALEQPPLQGDDVQTLQARLLALGYIHLGTADGIFGPNTEQAVRIFQTLNNLDVDGIVGPNTWSSLYAPTARAFDLHPIVDTQRTYLLGAATSTGWIEAGVAADLLAEMPYQLLSQSGAAQTATGRAPEPPQGPPCEDTRMVQFPSPVAADRPIAVAADWNTLPRPVTDMPTDMAELQAPVASALRVLGLPNPQLRITRALRADVDADGSEETILAATYRASGIDFPQPSAKTGDYSVLFVVPNGAENASVIAADVITTDITFGAPLEFRLLGLWDVNGDGTLEVASTADYYEGASTSIYTLEGTAAKEVLSGGCGV